MSAVVRLVQHPCDESVSGAIDGVSDGRAAERDVREFDRVPLELLSGMIISGSCDQRFLGTRREQLSGWVAAGGRLLVNGHPMVEFVDGLPELRKIEFHTQEDLWLSALEPHPIWDGIDRRDLLFSTGVPGEHDFAELERIGVAGFYARAFLARLPEGARAITGLGPGKLPVDVAYPLGRGEVIVHAGNDMGGFFGVDGPETRHGRQLIEHLEGR